MNEPASVRRRGRTTRLLEQAIAAAKEGGNVAFIAHTQRFADTYLRRLLRALAPDAEHTSRGVVHFASGGQIHVVTPPLDRARHAGSYFDRVIADHTTTPESVEVRQYFTEYLTKI